MDCIAMLLIAVGMPGYFFGRYYGWKSVNAFLFAAGLGIGLMIGLVWSYFTVINLLP